MRNRWVSLVLGVAALAALLALVFLEQRGLISGYARGEIVYKWHSASYWRKVLREDGQNGLISSETEGHLLWGNHEAVPLLLHLARDPDENVRWPALNLLARSGQR